MTTDDQAFLLDDVELFLGNCKLSINNSVDFEIEAATKIHYTFTKQRNTEEGTIIAQARSKHHLCCPVLSTIGK